MPNPIKVAALVVCLFAGPVGCVVRYASTDARELAIASPDRASQDPVGVHVRIHYDSSVARAAEGSKRALETAWTKAGTVEPRLGVEDARYGLGIHLSTRRGPGTVIQILNAFALGVTLGAVPAFTRAETSLDVERVDLANNDVIRTRRIHVQETEVFGLISVLLYPFRSPDPTKEALARGYVDIAGWAAERVASQPPAMQTGAERRGDAGCAGSIVETCSASTRPQ